MTICTLQRYDWRRVGKVVLTRAEPLLSQAVEAQVVWYVFEVVALEDEELWARASGIGVLALDEGPPLRADGG